MEDLDAALARALQQEEFAAAKHSQRDGLFGQLQGCLDKVTKCEDELLQALALSVLPLDELKAEASDALALNASLGETLLLAQEDLLAQQLLSWFKYKFFSWTDKAACRKCGNKATQLQSTQAPSPEEAKHDASRTEIYACSSCNALTRFPRYNDNGKLLETRCGRCGEWANCFMLFLRAAGFNARYVLDVTDHVWCEYYSMKLGRWVHLDPCEAAFDKPLLYEAGWGKKLSYVFGISTSGFVDIARRYTRNWAEVQTRRTALPEAELAAKLGSLNNQIRRGLPQDLLTKLQVRDLSEQLELLECVTSAPDAAALAALPGRTTGGLDWRQARGETGESGPNDATPTQKQAPATAYASAKDTTLGPVFATFGRLLGGACRAAGENSPGEAAQCVFNARLSSKWLDFGGAGPSGTTWLEYRLLVDQAPAVLVAYDLASGCDCPERDPSAWVLEGLEDGGQADQPWLTLDQREGVVFAGRGELRTFHIAPESRRACRSLRLRVTAARDPPGANSIQLACLNLYGSSDAPAVLSPEQAAVAVATAAAAADGGSAPIPAALDAQCVSVLHRLLSNIETKPADPRYRRVKASKLPAPLLINPQALALLAAAGFRPMLLPPDAPGAAGGAGAEEPFLMHAAGDEMVAAAARAAAVLREKVPALAAPPPSAATTSPSS